MDDYFDSDDKVCFYTGLPGLDSLKAILGFVEPHVNRKSKTLTAFQELVMVLMKLRLNVPQQDLAHRFDVSQSTVSRIFLSIDCLARKRGALKNYAKVFLVFLRKENYNSH